MSKKSAAGLACAAAAACAIGWWLAAPLSRRAAPPIAEEAAARSDPLPAGAILRIGTGRFRHRHESGQAAFSPDGRVIVSASLQYGPRKSKDDGRTGVVDFWEAETGRILARRPGRKAVFSADGASVAILDLDAVRVYDWPALPEEPRAELARERRDLMEFALSPDGRTVAAVYCVPTEQQQDRPDVPVYWWSDRRILAWDTHQDRVLWDVARPPGGRKWGDKPPYYNEERGVPRGVEFSPDGGLLAICFMRPDKVFLLDAASGEVVRELSEEGWCLATWFSADGAALYIAREDLGRTATETADPEGKALEVWDVATGALRDRLAIPEELRNWSCVVPSPDGARLAIGTRHTGAVVGVMDLETGEVHWSRPAPGLPFYDNDRPRVQVCFSPDGRTIAASLDRFVRLWDAATGAELPQTRRDLPDLTRLALAPDGTWVAVAVSAAGDAPRHIRRFDAANGQELGRLQAGFDHPIVVMAVSPDGRWLAACDTSGELRVWEVTTGRVVREFTFDNEVQSYFSGLSRESRRQALAFSPDGRRLAASSAARLFLLHVGDDWAEGPDIEIGYDSGALNAGFFLPASSTFVAAKHMKVRVLDLGDERPRVLRDLELDRVIYAAAPAVDGKSIALVTGRSNFHDVDQPTTLVWIETDDWTEQSRRELPDSARINSLACLSDRILACGENDGQITLRDARTGEVLARHYAHRHFDVQLETVPNGGRWASLGRTALVWDTDGLPETK